MRVSLTADPVEEVYAAKRILRGLRAAKKRRESDLLPDLRAHGISI